MQTGPCLQGITTSIEEGVKVLVMNLTVELEAPEPIINISDMLVPQTSPCLVGTTFSIKQGIKMLVMNPKWSWRL